MHQPGLCFAAAVMENTVFKWAHTLADLWNTCLLQAFVFYLNYLSSGCVHYVFFHAVKSCVKYLCRNTRAITYRNLFFCLMSQILKKSEPCLGDGMLTVFLLLFPSCPESEVKTKMKLWCRSSRHSSAVTHSRRIALLLTKRTKTQRWTRWSGCRYGTEGVNRKIFWIIKEETIYVVLVFVRTSVGAHPTGSLLFKQQIFVTLTCVEPLQSHQSCRHPDFFHYITDFWPQNKISQHASFHSYKPFKQNLYSSK